jgi:hypothetical protein
MSSERKTSPAAEPSDRTDESTTSTRHEGGVSPAIPSGGATARRSQMAGNYVRYIDTTRAGDHIPDLPEASDSTVSDPYITSYHPAE